jgi:hypothetical protein
MTLSPRLRKFALTVHVACSVGWIGAVAAFLALAIAGLASDSGQTVRGAYVAMEVIAWFVIVPLAFGALLTGLVQALGTTWGLFRHYWVATKLVLTVVATVVLLFQMDNIEFLRDAAAETTLSHGDLRGEREHELLHAAGGLAVLLINVVLAVVKPRGLTRRGWRKLREVRAASQS